MPNGSDEELEQFLMGVDEAGQPAPLNPPANMPPIDIPQQPAPVAAPVVAPAAPAEAVDPLEAEMLADVAKPQPGYLETAGRGWQRGVQQVKNAPNLLGGVLSEATGDLEGASDAALEHELSDQGPEDTSGYFTDIRNPDEFVRWTMERLGEQGPIMLASAITGGAGGIVANLVGRGLISATTGAAVGMGASNFALETAGTAEEQRSATGSFNPATTLTTGAVKAALETYAPFKFMKEVKGGTIPGALARGAGRELVTESAQEQADILARELNDPNYDYFSWDMVKRNINAGAAGLVVGGTYGGVGQAVAKVTGLDENDSPTGITLTEDEINSYPEPPPPIPVDPLEEELMNEVPDRGLEPGVLSHLRTQTQAPRVKSGDVGAEARTPAVMDVNETHVLDQDLDNDWRMTDAQNAALENVLNIEDDAIPRYAMKNPAGTWGTKLYTDTDIEQEVALKGNESGPPQLMKVDMNSLQPAAITADVFDLPPPGDSRIWYLPNVNPQQKAALEEQYVIAHAVLNSAREKRFSGPKGPELYAQSQQVYRQFLNQGMRVVPSRGSSFHYNAQIEGQETAEMPPSKRTVQVFTNTGQIRVGDTILPGADRKNLRNDDLEGGLNVLALDMNKVPEGSLQINPDSSVTILKEIPQNAITYGYPSDANIDPRMLRDTPATAAHIDVIKGGLEVNVTENTSPELKAKAEQAARWWREIQPWFRDMQKKLGVKNPIGLMINTDPDAVPTLYTGFQNSSMSYTNTNFIMYNIYKGQAGDVKYYQPPFTTKEGFIAAMTHELGHAITNNSWTNLPVRIKQQVYESYKRALLNYRVTHRTESVQPAIIAMDAPFPMRYYYVTFPEFLAEQFRRWATTNAQYMSKEQRFYKSVGRRMEGLYNGLVEKLGLDAAVELSMPDYAMDTWMDYLMESANSSKSSMMLSKIVRLLDEDYDLPSDLKATYALVVKAIEEWAPLVRRDVEIQVVEREEGDYVETENGMAEYMLGGFDFNAKTLKLMIGSLADLGISPERTLVHEAFHSIQDWLTPAERTLLVRMAREMKVMDKVNMTMYYRELKAESREWFVSEPDGFMANQWVKQRMENELMAHLVEARLRGGDFVTEVNTLLDKIIDLFKRVMEYMRGNGFQTPQDVLRSFYRGEITARANEDVTIDDASDDIQDYYETEDFSKVMSLDRLLLAAEKAGADISSGYPIFYGIYKNPSSKDLKKLLTDVARFDDSSHGLMVDSIDQNNLLRFAFGENGTLYVADAKSITHDEMIVSDRPGRFNTLTPLSQGFIKRDGTVEVIPNAHTPEVTAEFSEQAKPWIAKLEQDLVGYRQPSEVAKSKYTDKKIEEGKWSPELIEAFTMRQRIYDLERVYRGWGKDNIAAPDMKVREEAAREAAILRRQYREMIKKREDALGIERVDRRRKNVAKSKISVLRDKVISKWLETRYQTSLPGVMPDEMLPSMKKFETAARDMRERGAQSRPAHRFMSRQGWGSAYEQQGPLRFDPSNEGVLIPGSENQNEQGRYDQEVGDRNARKPPTLVKSKKKALQRTVIKKYTSEMGRNVEEIAVSPDKRSFWFSDPGTGARIGFIHTKKVKGIGWDILFIKNLFPGLDTMTLAPDMLRTAQKALGEPFKVSGTLTPDGYKMSRGMAPAQVKYHQFSPRDNVWYSPRQLKIQIATTLTTLEKMKQTYHEDFLLLEKDALEHYKELESKIPAEWYKDPGKAKAFSKRVLERRGEMRVVERAQEASEQELVAAISGTPAPVDPLLFQMHQEKTREGTEPELATMEFIFDWLKKGDKNPARAKYLTGLIDQGDKISKFSKLFFNLQQLTWRNLHIPGLRHYTELTEAYNSRRMEWISKANDTVKRWDQLPNKEREGITEILFWATEMNYRSAAEVRNKVVRHPDRVTELLPEFTRLGITQKGVAVFDEITQNFKDFLTAIENTTIANIKRTMPSSPTAMQAAINEVTADMAQLRAKPYFPMARFGEYTITVRNQFIASEPVVWFSTYATERERDHAIREVAKVHPGLALKIDKIPENVHEFMGLPATLLKTINAKLPGITPAQRDWIEQFQTVMAPERSFRKRFLKRKGTDGYSLDGLRAFSHYFRSGANYLARVEYKDQLQDQIRDVDASRKTLRDGTRRTKIVDYMQEHLDYIMKSGSDWATLKSLISIFQLGASISAAGMNLTQTPVVTLPYLGTLYGNRKAMGKLMKIMRATKQTFGKPKPGTVTTSFSKAREEMIKQGKIDVGQAPELGGYAEGANLARLSAGTKVQRAWRSFSYYSMWLFQHSERFNRELTFAAAYELAVEDPTNPHLVGPDGIAVLRIPEVRDLMGRLGISQEEAVATVAAREALDRTQFIYQPWARPTILRGGPASTVLVFFQYMQNMLYALGNNPGKEKMLIWLFVLYGLAGLPGADDLDKFIKWFSRRFFEKNFSPLDYARENMRDLTEGTVFDAVGPDLLLHGISRYSFGVGFIPDGYGVPRFDASASGAMGNIVPGLAPALTAAAAGKDWKEITSGVAQDVAGAGFGQMFAWMQFMDSQPGTMDSKKWERVMPRAAKAASKSIRYAKEGGDIDPKTGAPFVKFDMKDPDDIATVVFQAMGFTPTKVSAKWESVRAEQDVVDWYNYRKGILYVQLDTALRSDDSEAIDDVLAAIQGYNAELQGYGLGSLGISSTNLSSSMKARARTRALRSQNLPLTKGQVPLHNKIQDNYPGVVIEERKVR